MVLSSIPSSPTGLRRVEWGSLNLPASALFGTDGIRGRVGDLLTPTLARHVGFWAGQILRAASDEGVVILGQDSRNSSDMLAIALTEGLNAAGVDVWNLGLCPTPAVAHLTNTTDAIGGVMISASHNPPEDNGIKFFGASGSKLSSELQAQIETALRGKNTLIHSQGTGTHAHRPELLTYYTEALQASLVPQAQLKGMKIVLDLAWGAATHLAPGVFEALGATVICLHERPDGDRINVGCGSTHLAPLQAAVLEHGANLGFAFDGDADRVMAIDAQGRVVDGDYILYLWGQTLKQNNLLPDNLIISTVMANLGFERAWERQGGRLIRTAVGDQYVCAEMQRQGAKLGGEQSGHILCPHYGISGDGLLTALHLAAIAQQHGGSLAQLVDRSFKPYPQLLRNVRVDNREQRLSWKESDRLQGAIAAAEAAMGDQGRVLVRASGTEPVIRVMVEAADATLVQHWTDALVQAVQQYAR